MRWFVRLIAAAVVLAAGMGNAQTTTPKLALVIGNADYNLDGSITTPSQTSDSAGFPRDLQKPLNDAADITASLRRLHFDVTPLTNATRPQMIAGLAQFGQKVAGAGPTAIVMVYYSGHAMQVDGLNLLIPVGARMPGGYDYRRLASQTTQEILAGETVSLPLVFNQLNDPDGGVNIVILDSCRNNWWDAQINGAGRGPAAGGMSNRISTSRGAAERSTDLGATLIAFSTQPGNVADDGAPGARNSPYTTALKARLEQPGVTVLQLFNAVARDVQAATRDWSIPQRPWNNGVTLPDVCLAGCTQTASAVTLPPGSPPAANGAAAAPTPPPPSARPAPPASAPFSETGGRAPGNTFRECVECPEMVVIPGGTVVMGSPQGVGATNEHPQLTLPVGAFAVGQMEITNAQWDACVTAGGGCVAENVRNRGARNQATLPRVDVNWEGAQQYVRWLNGRLGINKYRLLTEAEWEYAARAGSDGAYPWGGESVSDHANIAGKAGKDRWDGLAPVGSFPANAFGLFDMHGNAAEWVQDRYNGYSTSRTTSAAMPSLGSGVFTEFVVRGGGAAAVAQDVRSASRQGLSAAVQFRANLGNPSMSNVGFRVARTLP